MPRASYLPSNLPSNPTYRKVNPADAPIMIIALTSDVYDRGAHVRRGLHDHVSKSFRRFEGVGQVSVGGSSLPAVRVELNPTQLNSYGLGVQDVQKHAERSERQSAQRANLGRQHDGRYHHERSTAKSRVLQADLIVGYHNGAAIKLSDVADVQDSVENIRAAGFVNGKPSVLLIIFRQPGANIIDTVDRIHSEHSIAESFDSGGN